MKDEQYITKLENGEYELNPFPESGEETEVIEMNINQKVYEHLDRLGIDVGTEEGLIAFSKLIRKSFEELIESTLE